MKENNFYEHVSRWIGSYTATAGIDQLRSFISNSWQPAEVKSKLLNELERKLAFLQKLPYFELQNGLVYLVDAEGKPCIYSNHLTALFVTAGLRMLGYSVAIERTNGDYHILQVQDEIMAA